MSKKLKRASGLRGAVAWAVVGAGCALPAVALAADQFGLGGTEPGAIPDTTTTDEPVRPATYCRGCHSASLAGEAPPKPLYYPYDTWAGTMMANSVRDPLFQAALSVANQDTAGIGSWCLRCHSQTAHVRGNTTPPDGSALDDIDSQGVGCDVCHRATSNNGSPLIGNAQLVWELGNVKHGPYSYKPPEVPTPDQPPGAPHMAVQSNYVTGSELCGGCHQVSNPLVNLVDDQGQDTGVPFPLDTTYAEWKASSFSQGSSATSCQGCHMTRHSADGPVCNLPGPARSQPALHTFVGGNLWGLDAVQAADPAYAMDHADSFLLNRMATEQLLKTAVSVAILDAPARAMPSTTIEVTVKVENHTGHKFPTGYAESRRAFVSAVWLDSDAADGADGNTVLGAYDPTSGELSMDPPTRVYQAVHGQWQGSAALPGGHLALNNTKVSDTRIPPAGFQVDGTTRPKGYNYSNANGGYNSFDQAKLTIPVPAELGVRKLSIRVFYQSVTREYVDFLVAENKTDQKGTALKGIYDATNQGPPILLAEAVQLVEVAGNVVDAGVEAGTPAPPAAPVESGNGCGCRVPAAERASSGAWVLVLLGMIALKRKKSRTSVGRR